MGLKHQCPECGRERRSFGACEDHIKAKHPNMSIKPRRLQQVPRSDDADAQRNDAWIQHEREFFSVKGLK